MLRRTYSSAAVAFAFALSIAANLSAGTIVADFEDLAAPPVPSHIYNGSDLAGGFDSHSVHFVNNYNTTFQSWSGFGYGDGRDVTTPGVVGGFVVNEGSAYANLSGLPAGGGDGNSARFGVAYLSSFDPPPEIDLPAGATVSSARFTNTTYAAISMLNGDSFAKKFGGPTGSDPDFLKLLIHGFNGNAPTGTVTFNLADFTFANSASDYIVKDWTTVDLSSLGNANRLVFDMQSSDVTVDPVFGTFTNTPTYFAIDNLTLTTVPEPATWLLAIVGAMGVWAVRRRR